MINQGNVVEVFEESIADDDIIVVKDDDLMMDPVIACDGHSYERGAIEKWLSKSKKSPMTGLRLKSTVLIPNHGLKGAISEWLDD